MKIAVFQNDRRLSRLQASYYRRLPFSSLCSNKGSLATLSSRKVTHSTEVTENCVVSSTCGMTHMGTYQLNWEAKSLWVRKELRMGLMNFTLCQFVETDLLEKYISKYDPDIHHICLPRVWKLYNETCCTCDGQDLLWDHRALDQSKKSHDPKLNPNNIICLEQAQVTCRSDPRYGNPWPLLTTSIPIYSPRYRYFVKTNYFTLRNYYRLCALLL
jgi:hypothetical protein